MSRESVQNLSSIKQGAQRVVSLIDGVTTKISPAMLVCMKEVEVTSRTLSLCVVNDLLREV
jgi:hypothetical protein